MGAEAEQGYTLDGMNTDMQNVGGRVGCQNVYEDIVHSLVLSSR